MPAKEDRTSPQIGPSADWRCWLAGAKAWTPWLLVLLPAMALWSFMREHVVNMPFLDDLMSVPLFQKAAHEGLSWHDFFAPQMEHRIAFTRLVLLIFYKLWPAGFAKQMWLSFALLCLTLVNIIMLLRQTSPVPLRRCWPVLTLASLCLFSPVQHQVVLWAFMHQVAGIAFFLTGALAVWQSGRSVWMRFLVSIVCAMCATLSISSGILVWVLALPVILWSAPGMGSRTRIRVTALWLSCFVVTMVLYFHGLKNEVPAEFALGQGNQETMGRNLGAFFSDPSKSIEWAFEFLGAPLSRGTNRDLIETSLWYGVAGLVLYLACAGYWLLRFRDVELRRRLVCWLSFGAYSIGTAMLVALGRVWLTKSGVNAMSSRYLIHAIPLQIALVMLVWLVVRDLMERAKSEQVRGAWGESLIVAGVVFACLLLSVWSFGERMMGVWGSARLRSATNALFYKTGCPLEYDNAGMPGLAIEADDLGMIKPRMLKNRHLENFRVMPSPMNVANAEWSELHIEHTPAGWTARASGFARDRKHDRVVDGVFLAWQVPQDGRWEIFHVTQVTGLPMYLMESLRKGLEFTHAPYDGIPNSVSSWDATFTADGLPKGVIKIAAWACDYAAMSVHLIPKFYEVDTVTGTSRELGGDPESIGLKDYVRLAHALRER